jgi:hypothetical protein
MSGVKPRSSRTRVRGRRSSRRPSTRPGEFSPGPTFTPTPPDAHSGSEDGVCASCRWISCRAGLLMEELKVPIRVLARQIN